MSRRYDLLFFLLLHGILKNKQTARLALSTNTSPVTGDSDTPHKRKKHSPSQVSQVPTFWRTQPIMSQLSQPLMSQPSQAPIISKNPTHHVPIVPSPTPSLETNQPVMSQASQIPIMSQPSQSPTPFKKTNPHKEVPRVFAPSLVGAVALGGGATSNVAAPLVGAVGWGAVGVGVRGRVPWGWVSGAGCRGAVALEGCPRNPVRFNSGAIPTNLTALQRKRISTTIGQ